MDVRIITNHHSRELVCHADLPDKVADEFELEPEDIWSPRFVQYRDSWYDTTDCDGLANNIGITGWDLYCSDSFFSGIVFRWPATGDTDASGDLAYDYDNVVVGTYIGS